MGLESAASFIPVKAKNSMRPKRIPKREEIAVLCATSLGYRPGSKGKSETYAPMMARVNMI